jgi:hypothetical protein
MDLKDFVKESLVQIASGVKESQEAVRDAGGYVCPAIRIASEKTDNSQITFLPDGRNIFLVDFDIAVTVSESTNTDAGARLKVASFGDIGGGVVGSTGSAATNRVTFKVPVVLPADEQSLEELQGRDAGTRGRKQEQERKVASHSNRTNWP